MRISALKKICYPLIKWSFVIIIIMLMTVILISPTRREQNKIVPLFGEVALPYNNHQSSPNNNWRQFSKQQIDSLSVLGRYLFLEEPPPAVENSQKKYKILMWKYGKAIERRHIFHFTDKKHDPFEKCSVKNCEITYNDNEISTADAVLVHLQRLKGVQDLPKENKPRKENQRWVFLTDENPIFTFFSSKVKIKDFNGKFNWSMTFRIESDVPVPYGRTILNKNSNKNVLKNNNTDLKSENEEKEKNEVESHVFKKRLDVLVAVMGSNCGGRNHRWNYVKELQKYINVDFYGKCGTLKCPGHFSRDCGPIADYKFYLSFENSNCPQYITEKLWWNAYSKNSIPIVMGASKSDYKQLLPPKSYINIEDFARPVDLARYILYVNKTDNEYASYFEWKKNFRVLNEHGYFQSDSYHYCRLCEALNYNSKENKVYNDLEKFWNKKDCYASWDEV